MKVKVKVFTLNQNQKIELTEKELKSLLDEVYWEGYWANSNKYTWTSPNWWYDTNHITCSSASGKPVSSDGITISGASTASDYMIPNTVYTEGDGKVTIHVDKGRT